MKSIQSMDYLTFDTAHWPPDIALILRDLDAVVQIDKEVCVHDTKFTVWFEKGSWPLIQSRLIGLQVQGQYPHWRFVDGASDRVLKTIAEGVR